MKYEEYVRRLGLKIKYYRNLKGITQEQLAEILGNEDYMISNLETGKRNITLRTLHKISEALDVESSKLFEF